MCEQDACKTCTGCYHGKHDTCRGEVRCPADGITRPCGCCGGAS